jgi:hypothetical protein
MLARTCRAWRDDVEFFGLASAGVAGSRKLRARAFVNTVERVRWATANGLTLDARVAALAARRGKLDVLKYLQTAGCALDARAVAAAARGGHLDVIEWAIERGCATDARACAQAARGGHLDLLKTLRAKTNFPWDASTPSAAARGGRRDVVRWLDEQKCPRDEKAVCAMAARSGNVELVKWVISRYEWDVWTPGLAARGGHVEILRLVWATKPDCFNDVVSMCAAKGGHWRVMDWISNHRRHAIQMWSHRVFEGWIAPYAAEHGRAFFDKTVESCGGPVNLVYLNGLKCAISAVATGNVDLLLRINELAHRKNPVSLYYDIATGAERRNITMEDLNPLRKQHP